MKQGVLKSVAWLELIVLFIPVLAWPLFAFMSIFVFDAPGSEKNWILLSLVGIALGYPALYVLALIKTLQNFKNKNNLGAVLYASLPILGFVAFGLLLLLLENSCNGNFSCE